MTRKSKTACSDPAEKLADELLGKFGVLFSRESVLAAIHWHYPEPQSLCGNCGKFYKRYGDAHKHGTGVCFYGKKPPKRKRPRK